MTEHGMGLSGEQIGRIRQVVSDALDGVDRAEHVAEMILDVYEGYLRPEIAIEEMEREGMMNPKDARELMRLVEEDVGLEDAGRVERSVLALPVGDERQPEDIEEMVGALRSMGYTAKYRRHGRGTILVSLRTSRTAIRESLQRLADTLSEAGYTAWKYD